MTDREPVYRRHRFPAEIIATGWLYFRFPLSPRMVEDGGSLFRIGRSDCGRRNSGAPLLTRSASAHPGGSEECEQMPDHAVARSDDTQDAGSHVRREPDDEAYAPILLGSELAVRIEI